MNFRIGQKVVCINDGTLDPTRLSAGRWIKAGNIYTIRWLGEFPWKPDRQKDRAIRLVEINRGGSRQDEWSDYPFSLSRFRPTIERSTEIGMAILRKVAADAAKRRNLVIAGH